MSTTTISRLSILALVAAYTAAEARWTAPADERDGAAWTAIGRPQSPGSVAAWIQVLAADRQAWEHPARHASIAADRAAREAAALAVAEREAQQAQDALADALDGGPWGQQPGEHGRVFLRRWGGWPQDDSRSLQVCVDGLPVATVRLGWDTDLACRAVLAVQIHDRAVEHAAREAQRAAGRAANAAYEALLDEAAGHILAGLLPAAWEIIDGQKGGYIATSPEYYTSAGGYRYSTGSGPRVSCAGALRRAGITPGDDAAATLREHLATVEAEQRPRLSARSRRLPASDRRRVEASL